MSSEAAPTRMRWIATAAVGIVCASGVLPTSAATPVPPPPAPAARQPSAARPAQTIDTIRLGLKAHGARQTAGVSLEIPAGWTRVAVPETFLLEFGGPSDTGRARLRLLIEAVRVPAGLPLARETEAIRSTIEPGVENYRAQNDADVTVAMRPARRLTLTFKSMDDPALQRQEYLLVRAGETVFKILVDGPETEAAAILRVLDRVAATLAVAG